MEQMARISGSRTQTMVSGVKKVRQFVHTTIQPNIHFGLSFLEITVFQSTVVLLGRRDNSGRF